MRKQYMVTMKVDAPFSQDFVDKLPAQRAFINELFQEGRIALFTVAADRQRAWFILNASDRTEVDDILADFPVVEHVKPYIEEVAFTGLPNMMPTYSLN